MSLGVLPPNGEWHTLEFGAAQILPLKADTKYSFKVALKASAKTEPVSQLVIYSKPGNFTPDTVIDTIRLDLQEGVQDMEINFKRTLDKDQYAFIMFRPHPDVLIAMSDLRMTGILSVFSKYNLKVGNTGRQTPPEGSGFESFEFWCPERRPDGKNIAMEICPAIIFFDAGNIANGYTRPGVLPNAWVASLEDDAPALELSWDSPQTVHGVTVFFDNDYDHAMESVQYGHPEDVIPFCVRDMEILTGDGKTLRILCPRHPGDCFPSGFQVQQAHGQSAGFCFSNLYILD